MGLFSRSKKKDASHASESSNAPSELTNNKQHGKVASDVLGDSPKFNSVSAKSAQSALKSSSMPLATSGSTTSANADQNGDKTITPASPSAPTNAASKASPATNGRASISGTPGLSGTPPTSRMFGSRSGSKRGRHSLVSSPVNGTSAVSGDNGPDVLPSAVSISSFATSAAAGDKPRPSDLFAGKGVDWESISLTGSPSSNMPNNQDELQTFLKARRTWAPTFHTEEPVDPNTTTTLLVRSSKDLQNISFGSSGGVGDASGSGPSTVGPSSSAAGAGGASSPGISDQLMDFSDLEASHRRKQRLLSGFEPTLGPMGGEGTAPAGAHLPIGSSLAALVEGKPFETSLPQPAAAEATGTTPMEQAKETDQAETKQGATDYKKDADESSAPEGGKKPSDSVVAAAMLGTALSAGKPTALTAGKEVPKSKKESKEERRVLERKEKERKERERKEAQEGREKELRAKREAERQTALAAIEKREREARENADKTKAGAPKTTVKTTTPAQEIKKAASSQALSSSANKGATPTGTPEKTGRPGSIRAMSIRSRNLFSFGRRKENVPDPDEEARKEAKRQKKEQRRSVSANAAAPAATAGVGAAAATKAGKDKVTKKKSASEATPADAAVQSPAQAYAAASSAPATKASAAPAEAGTATAVHGANGDAAPAAAASAEPAAATEATAAPTETTDATNAANSSVTSPAPVAVAARGAGVLSAAAAVAAVQAHEQQQAGAAHADPVRQSLESSNAGFVTPTAGSINGDAVTADSAQAPVKEAERETEEEAVDAVAQAPVDIEAPKDTVLPAAIVPRAPDADAASTVALHEDLAVAPAAPAARPEAS